MRIQHNITAMNAYRNYNANTSALSKNLERLSSGYRINRAGDDAAGLAISEKMRAQITGLKTAQKNAKDGISLVQTAEGALTEVHDMLNRMYELAEQSANGTYDNEVDRNQIQKELDSMRTEINRISKASNFNGIQLLDGSLDSNATTTQYTNLEIAQLASDNAAAVVGVDGTIVHSKGQEVAKTVFQVDLNNAAYKIDTTSGDDIKINLTSSDGKTLTLTMAKADVDDASGGTDGDVLDAEALATAIAGEIKTSGGKVTVGGDFAVGAANGEIKLSSATTPTDAEIFTVRAEGNQLIFEQKGNPTDSDEVIDGKWSVATEGLGAAVSGTTETIGVKTPQNLSNFDIASIDVSSLGDDAVDKEIKVQYYAVSSGSYTAGALEVDVGGTKFYHAFGAADITNATVGSATGIKLTTADGTRTDKAHGDLNGQSVTLKTNDGSKSITVTLAATVDKLGKDKAVAASAIAQASIGTVTKESTTAVTGVSGNPDINASTEVITQGQVASADRLASTWIDASKFTNADGSSAIKDGSALKVGDKTYVFKVGENSKANTTGATVVDLTAYTGKETDFVKTALTKLTDAAQADGNDMFSIGFQGGKLTFTEQETYQTTAGDDAVDLSTREAIAKQFSFAAEGIKSGNDLVLQIGDDGSDYNRLAVNIKACNTASMGTYEGDELTTSIDDIDISTQQGALDALKTIKDAVNYVSDVRGTLGATQNRLDHTINNLSVMQENIQNAESTIRDVDIAEEMMEYTKNNILVQSAQAMLAQANQLPQGVLQLLQ